jgi:hypothetical protein
VVAFVYSRLLHLYDANSSFFEDVMGPRFRAARISLAVFVSGYLVWFLYLLASAWKESPFARRTTRYLYSLALSVVLIVVVGAYVGWWFPLQAGPELFTFSYAVVNLYIWVQAVALRPIKDTGYAPQAGHTPWGDASDEEEEGLGMEGDGDLEAGGMAAFAVGEEGSDAEEGVGEPRYRDAESDGEEEEGHRDAEAASDDDGRGGAEEDGAVHAPVPMDAGGVDAEEARVPDLV